VETPGVCGARAGRPSRIRILLADDHEKVRVQVRLRLNREPDFQVVAEAINSPQVVEHAVTFKPCIALMDPMMGDGLGLETVGWLAAHLPETTIVVLTAVADTALRLELKKIGVRRIVHKELSTAQLIGTLREIGNAVALRREDQTTKGA
jgi:DNA-binding NarL/FixJ family response regulator